MYYKDVGGPASITYVAYALMGMGGSKAKCVNNTLILLTHTPEKLDKGSELLHIEILSKLYNTEEFEIKQTSHILNLFNIIDL
jgi:hypothetical protein